MRWNKDYFQHPEGNMKYWYHELPFIGERCDLTLARRVWTIIYLPMIFLGLGLMAQSSVNWINDWFMLPIGIALTLWSYLSLHFIWVNA